MATNSCESIAVADTNSCDQLSPADEVLELRRVGDTIPCSPAGRRLLRVLIVEDDRDTANSLAMLVKIWGHDVRVAYGGATALETASAYHPDIMLLDIGMPRMDGNHLAQQLRRQTEFKDTLLIAITGYADAPHCLLSEQAGFDHYLIKPVDPLIVEKMLRLHQERLAESPEASRPNPRTYGLLVVDDEEGVRVVLDTWLRQQGFAVLLAANGKEALDLYRRHRQAIDMVLLDVQMPGLDGPKTLAAIRESNPRIPCCFMSGSLGDYTEEGLRDLGVAKVFRKPFRLDEVAQVLRDQVSRADLSLASV